MSHHTRPPLRSRRLALLLPIVTFLLVLAPGGSRADGPQTGIVDGRVLDSDGEPLPGVAVTLAGAQGEQATTTDAEGAFRFSLVNPGEYTVGAKLEGLGSTELETSVSVGQRQSITLRLRPATAETITVTAEGALVDRYSVGSSAALDSDVAEKLAFKGRNYQSSVEVLPGVVHDAQSRFAGDIDFAVNGGQYNENAGLVDGVDTSFARFNGSSRSFLPSSAVEEVRVDSAGFGVEYGRVVSGITSAVVKSGTNQFHGSLLWIPQNQKWRAEYDALDIPREDEVINSVEGGVGGPLVRDRAWFFASYSEQDTNEVDLYTDGTLEDVGFKNEVSVLKLNAQPSQRHYLSVLGIDSPLEKIALAPNAGDRFSGSATEFPGEVYTASWGFSINPKLMLETKIASQRNENLRQPVRVRELLPGASPDSPLGNNFSYQDRVSNLRYNAIAQSGGTGFHKIPRSQANASLSVFAGDHELKLGADYQDIEMDELNDIGKRYQGLTFDTSLPGGFATPQFVDVFDPSTERTSSSEIGSLYAQDRITLGEHWVLAAGLRVDDQSSTNDVGQEAASFTKTAPRLTAIYDVRADGKLLLKANAGRYYQIFNQDFVSREFSREPDGTNTFTRFAWNPATARYDRFQSRTVAALDTAIRDISPYYKDEATAGMAWQFAPAWVLEAQAIWWELEDLFWATDQFDAGGRMIRDVRNWDAGFREHRAIQLEANRAFRGGWTLRTNYTHGRNEGNSFGASHFVLDDDDLFDALGGVELGTGRTDATIVNREGRGPNDRPHNLNVVALKQWSFGEHSLGLGGYFGFRSGERWGLRPNTQVRHPISGQTIATSTYRQPRDAEKLEDTSTLNLNANWTFPIRGIWNGRLGVEVANVTNEQEIIGINVANGRPLPGRLAFQSPREIRLQAGITF